MIQQLLPIGALLLGSAFLLFAGGINALILPVRGAAEGFSALSLGLLGTGWAIGYISGCLLTPKLVARVGHIRSFSVMAAVAALAILASLLLLKPVAWILLRAFSGFCFAGAAMIVESWLSERASPTTRGKIFGIYTMVNLLASTGGQLMLTIGDTSGYLFFVLGAMFYCLALVPTAVSSSATPKPLVSVRIDLGGLWKNSPVAVFAVLMVGISNSAFGTLAAVYGSRIGLVVSAIALFSSIPILAGAVAQIPVGYLSDRIDRRKVLIGTALVAAVADIAFIVFRPEGGTLNLLLVSIFGAAIFAMYPIIISHANDHVTDGNYIKTSSGLLMVFGVGSVIGPLCAGVAMSAIGALGLFATTLFSHVAIVLFALWRIRQRAPAEDSEKVGFAASPPARSSTPETVALASDQSDAPVPPEALGAYRAGKG